MEDELIEALRNGVLHLDCNDICVTQRTTEKPQVFRGPGFIRQEPDGKLSFKIYPKESDQKVRHWAGSSSAAGVLVPDNNYYTFQATDFHGRTWTCNRVWPDISESYLGKEPVRVIDGDLYAIVSEKEGRARSYLTLHYFGEHKIPCNAGTDIETRIAGRQPLRSGHLNLANFRSDGREFLLAVEPGQLVVERLADSLPQNFEQRVTEALQFVLAKPLRMRVMRFGTNGKSILKIVSPQRIASGTRSKRPIDSNNVSACYWTWILFDRYLRFIGSHSEESWHPCSKHLSAVCDASAGSLEGECLALCVAIEGIVKELFPDTVSIPEGFKGLVGELFTQVDKWLKGNQMADEYRLADRLKGFRGQLLDVRPVDVLKKLERDGVIEEKHVKNWKDLRNAAAHARQPGTKGFQDLIDMKNVVVALLYRLIFQAIGYVGQFTDYGSRGFPPAIFPSSKVAEEVSEDSVTYRTTAFERELMWGITKGKWMWEMRKTGSETPEKKGQASGLEHAMQQAYGAASVHLIEDDFRGKLKAEDI
jgi:hypothetical protein